MKAVFSFVAVASVTLAAITLPAYAQEPNEFWRLEARRRLEPPVLFNVSDLSSKPTFNCSNAQSGAARIICDYREGADADWDLVSAFWALKYSLTESERPAFERAEKEWVESLDGKCRLIFPLPDFLAHEKRCVLDAYHQRAAQFRSQLRGDALTESKLSPEERAEIQAALIARGFLNGEADGEFGPRTRAAIRRFLESQGLPPSEFLSLRQRNVLLEQPAMPPRNDSPILAEPDFPNRGDQGESSSQKKYQWIEMLDTCLKTHFQQARNSRVKPDDFKNIVNTACNEVKFIAYAEYLKESKRPDMADAMVKKIVEPIVDAQKGNTVSNYLQQWYADKAQSDRSEKPPKEANNGSSSGTGFFISKDGKALTNAHVVKGCREINVTVQGQMSRARVVARDEANDLALLATDRTPLESANWRLSLRQGEEILVYGYPLKGLSSEGGVAVSGNVNALSGFGDDVRYLQISAPIQPGNSGGPVLDKRGNVVGIVVATLDALKVMKAIEHIPQNVNFAVKGAVAATFLEAQGVVIQNGKDDAPMLSAPDISQHGKALAVAISCTH